MDKNDVKARATGHWRDIATAIGLGPEFLAGKHGPCPKCGGTDRWRVFEDFKETGGAICNQCGQHLGDGFALVQWWNGCDFPAALHRVADCLGMANGKPRIVATYDYTDEHGRLLFQVCRCEPKDFRQRRPDGNGGWTWKTKGVRKVLYRLPQLVAAAPGKMAFIVEGEKDVHSVEAIGLLATCNPGGAGKWKADYSRALKDRAMVIIPDNDEPGRHHADQVAQSLVGIAKSIKVVELPAGKDAADWVQAGGTREQLIAHLKAAPRWTPPERPRAPRHRRDATTSSLLVSEGRTECANARRLVEQYGDVVRWCGPWEKWLVWDCRRWKQDGSLAIDALAKNVVDRLWQEARALARDMERDTADAVWRFVRSSNQAMGVRNMVTLARCDVAVLPAELDTHPWLLNCLNGTLDLTTGQLRPHDKGDFITQLCPVEYHPEAAFPIWRGFLDGVLGGDKQLVTYIQWLVGLCLTGSTREHLLPLLYGVGSNGKSVFIDTILTMLGPDYAIKAGSDLLLTKRDTHPTEKADLYGKRFVACVEAEDGRRLAESLVKELTGGDRIRARRMREDFWEFAATHKVFLASNHKPTVRGTDHGIWRRIKLLPFTRIFWDPDKGESGPEKLRMEKTMADKLKTELPGILAWAVEGCRQWLADGLREPDCVRSATGQYRDEMDLVGRFIADCCVVGPDLSVGATALFEAFKKWCENTGERAVTQMRFGMALTERGHVSDLVSGGRKHRFGIGLLDEGGL